MTYPAAPDLVQTDAEKAALDVVLEQAGGDSPLERHGTRLFHYCVRQAELRDVEIDRELVLIAALLHDIGLYDGASHGGVYVTDGAEFTMRLLKPYDWGEERLSLCFDTIEKHHELRAQWDRGNEVEFMRRADLIDLSAGAVNFGVPRSEIAAIKDSIPRRGLYPAIGRLLVQAARERPSTLPKIFRRS